MNVTAFAEFGAGHLRFSTLCNEFLVNDLGAPRRSSALPLHASENPQASSSLFTWSAKSKFFPITQSFSSSSSVPELVAKLLFCRAAFGNESRQISGDLSRSFGHGHFWPRPQLRARQERLPNRRFSSLSAWQATRVENGARPGSRERARFTLSALSPTA